MERFTCSYEHYIILSIFCFHFVHHDLRKLVIHVCFDYDWSIVDGVDRIKHSWVAPSKGHDLIGELLCGVIPTERFAWALWMEQVRFHSKGRESVEFHPGRRAYGARPRVRNPSLVGDPLVIWSISMSIRTQKDPPDVGHAVHTHS